MTTVSVTPPQDEVSLGEVMGAWFDDEDAVYPYDAVYAEGETDEQSDSESAVEMVRSQDAAIAVALTELGYDLETTRRGPARSSRACRPTACSRPATRSSRSTASRVDERRRRGRRVGGRGRDRELLIRRDGERTATVELTRQGRHPTVRASASPWHRLRLPVRRRRPHRPAHRRAQRRADLLPRRLRHAHPRLADRRPRHRRHRRRSTRTAPLDPSAASSRRSSAPRTPAPSSSSCPPPTATQALGAPTRT